MNGPRSKPLAASVLRSDDPDAALEAREIAGLHEEDRENAEFEKYAFCHAPASAREPVGAER